jgi:hypothetical protein
MELFCFAKCIIFAFTSKKNTKLSAMEKILSEEIAKYDDTTELEEDHRTALFVFDGKILVITLNRTIFRL